MSSANSANSANSPKSKKHVMNAGIIFTSNDNVLAAYQRKWIKDDPHNNTSWRDHRFISGFGGKAEDGETPLKAAIRETLEEIYEFIKIPNPHHQYNNKSNGIWGLRKEAKIPKDLLDRVESSIQFKQPFQKSFKNGVYFYFHLNYADLNQILQIVNSYLILHPDLLIRSITYPITRPTNIHDLLHLPRNDLQQNIEVLRIIQLDMNDLSKKQNINSNISSNFEGNIQSIKNNRVSRIHLKNES